MCSIELNYNYLFLCIHKKKLFYVPRSNDTIELFYNFFPPLFKNLPECLCITHFFIFCLKSYQVVYIIDILVGFRDSSSDPTIKVHKWRNRIMKIDR